MMSLARARLMHAATDKTRTGIRRGCARRSGAIEELEARRLLAAAGFRFGADHLFHPPDDASFASQNATSRAYPNYQVYNPLAGAGVRPFGSPTPFSGARSPAQIRKSYGVDVTRFGGIAGDGTGQTIAIIDAFDDASFVSDTSPDYSNSDLARFDSYYGLPDPPSFKKFDQNGGTNYPASGVTNGWTLEISLDVEWAHAMAPNASIWLVEANTDNDSDAYAAVDWARQQPAVTVISMSFGETEFSDESDNDVHFVTPAGHQGISFVASSGDTGGVVQYPSSSPDVIAVGGTTLNQSSPSGAWSSETGWSGSGGGISASESKPAYQNILTTPSSTQRTVPDVAADADYNTGVAVLDSAAGGSANPWVNGRVGGTSVGAPLWAGIIAMVNQGRSLLSTPLGSLDGFTQALPRLYTLTANDFHDITTGSAGSFSAGPGYDLVTGRGSPRVNLLAPDLAGGATITGRVFVDSNGDGVFDTGETAQSDVGVYLDLNNNGVFDSAFEPSATTDANGVYAFDDLVGGTTFAVRETTPADFVRASALQTITAYNTVNTFDIINIPTVFNGSAGNDSYTLSLDPTGTNALISDGTNNYSIARNLLSTLSFNGNGGDDTLTIDAANGSPIPAGGISFNGGANGTSTGDALALVGGSGAEFATFNAGSVSFGGTIDFSNVENLSFDGAGGNDSLAVNSGTVTIPATQTLASLSIASGALVRLASGSGLVVATQSLSLAGTIDLTDNALVVDYSGASPLDSILGLINTARAPDAFQNPTWSGNGITSSLAAASPGSRTVAAIDNASLASAYGTFLSQPVDTSSVLVRYTVIGDANLDGVSNTSDFLTLAQNFGATSQTWGGGDFNFDGRVNALDFNSIATNFGESVPPPRAPATALLFSDRLVSDEMMQWALT